MDHVNEPEATVATQVNPRFSYLEFCTLAGGEIDRLAELVAGSDLGLRVPWSRVWRVEDVAHHEGAIHRWAADLVATRARRYRPIRDSDDWRSDVSAAEVARWLVIGRDRLLSVLEGAERDRKMWAWGADQHVRFWARRMTHETGIHRADAELALGLEPTFDPQVAADGMSEFLENLWKARAWRRGMGALRGEGETIAFVATDVRETWTVVRTAQGFIWEHKFATRSTRSDVAVFAPVCHLYLFAWKRLRSDHPGLKIRGDTQGLDHWLRHCSV